MTNRITMEQAVDKMQALADELNEHGYHYFLMAVDLLEQKTEVVFRRSEAELNLLLTVAMELAAHGVPVPLLMSAIMFGNQVFNDTNKEQTVVTPAEDGWEEVIYDENLH